MNKDFKAFQKCQNFLDIFNLITWSTIREVNYIFISKKLIFFNPVIKFDNKTTKSLRVFRLADDHSIPCTFRKNSNL